MSGYRTVPEATQRIPGGIPYIVGNEFAERFSFYGMQGILTIYMTRHLVDGAGNPDPMNDEQAKTVFHLFTAAVYAFPLMGSILSDVLLGKYRTILLLSLGYCIGHAVLAIGDAEFGSVLFSPRGWLFLGMACIACGAGGIKPCVSAHVGDQFGLRNQHLLSKVFGWFYFFINVGAALSNLVTPLLLEKVGPWLAFGLPGVLMMVATGLFWLGRYRVVHIPPAGAAGVWATVRSPAGRQALLNLTPIFLVFIPVFWAIFGQTGSAWVLQAAHMDRQFLGFQWYEAQIQVANPILILLLIPLFSYVVYPLVGQFCKITPLRKMSVGLLLAAAAFAISGWLEVRIQSGEQPSIGWQLVAYVVLTAAEVLVSITSLEFAYTQAPPVMKSVVMGIYFGGVALGNLLTSGVNWMIQRSVGESLLAGANYYWFFTGLMTVAAVGFVLFTQFYRGNTFVQGGRESGSE